MSVDLMKTVTYETAGAEGNRNPSSANGARRRTEVPPGPFTDPEMPLINVSVRQGVVYDTDARAPAARRPSPFSNGAVRRQVVAAPRFTIGAQRGAFQGQYPSSEARSSFVTDGFSEGLPSFLTQMSLGGEKHPAFREMGFRSQHSSETGCATPILPPTGNSSRMATGRLLPRDIAPQDQEFNRRMERCRTTLADLRKQLTEESAIAVTTTADNRPITNVHSGAASSVKLRLNYDEPGKRNVNGTAAKADNRGVPTAPRRMLPQRPVSGGIREDIVYGGKMATPVMIGVNRNAGKSGVVMRNNEQLVQQRQWSPTCLSAVDLPNERQQHQDNVRSTTSGNVYSSLPPYQPRRDCFIDGELHRNADYVLKPDFNDGSVTAE